MLAQVAELFGVAGQPRAKVRLLIRTEHINRISNEAKCVDVILDELIARAIFLVPFRVEAKQFGKNHRARDAQCAGAVENLCDFLRREIFNLRKREPDRAHAGVLKILAGLDDFAGLPPFDQRSEHRRKLFDQPQNIISRH